HRQGRRSLRTAVHGRGLPRCASEALCVADAVSMEPLGDSLRSMNAFDEKVVARVRRHCVTHAKLYLTFGTAIAVSACVTMGALALHADGEARAQTAQQE